MLKIVGAQVIICWFNLRICLLISGAEIINPIRQPDIPKFFEREFTMIIPFLSGAILAIDLNFLLTKSEYASSIRIKIFLFIAILYISLSSSSVYTLPLGYLGYL